MLDYFGTSYCDVCSQSLSSGAAAAEAGSTVLVLSCGHAFCTICSDTISSALCPVCGTTFDADSTQELVANRTDGCLKPARGQWMLTTTQQAARLEDALETISQHGCAEAQVYSIIHECFSFLREQPGLMFRDLQTSARLMVHLVKHQKAAQERLITERNLKNKIRQLSSEKAELRKRLSEVEIEKEAEIAIALASEPDLREYSLKLRQQYNLLHQKYTTLVSDASSPERITRDSRRWSTTSSPSDSRTRTAIGSSSNHEAPSLPPLPSTPTQRTVFSHASEASREEFIPSFPHQFDRRPSPEPPLEATTSSDPRLKRTSAHAHPGAVLAKASEQPEFFSTIADEPLPNTIAVQRLASFLDMDSPYSSPAGSTHRTPSILSLPQAMFQDGMSSTTSSPQSTLRRQTAYRNMHFPVRPALRDSTFSTYSGISTPSSPPAVELPLEPEEQQLAPPRWPGLRARAASTSQVELASRDSQILNDHRRMHSDPSTAIPSGESSDVEVHLVTPRERPSSSTLALRAPRVDTISLPPSSDRGSIISQSIASHGRTHSRASTWGTVASNGVESTASSLSGVQLIGFHNQRHSTQLSIRTDTSSFRESNRDSLDTPMPRMSRSFLGLGDDN